MSEDKSKEQDQNPDYDDWDEDDWDEPKRKVRKFKERRAT